MGGFAASACALRARRVGAFGAGALHRDLALARPRGVRDSALVPVRTLVNDRSRAAVVREAVTYFHVELEARAVLLADGLPEEIYLNTGNA
jgi:hypothetical protein